MNTPISEEELKNQINQALVKGGENKIIVPLRDIISQNNLKDF